MCDRRLMTDGWFDKHMPDLNQHQAHPAKYLIQNSIWWIETIGYDAIRMDTLPHVPRSFWATVGRTGLMVASAAGAGG